MPVDMEVDAYCLTTRAAVGSTVAENVRHIVHDAASGSPLLVLIRFERFDALFSV